MPTSEVKPNQLTLGGEFSHVLPSRESGLTPKADLSQFKLSEEEQNTINELIKKEVPNLRLVKEGNMVCKRSKGGHPFDVLLQNDAIITRAQKKEPRNRPFYLMRFPGSAISCEYKNIVFIKKGEIIDPYSRQKKIPKKQIPEIEERLRKEYEAILLQRFRSREPFSRQKA